MILVIKPPRSALEELLVLGVSDSTQKTYFSPDKYSTAELYIQVENTHLMEPNLHYSLLLAGGIQIINEEEGQSTIRAEGQLGYRMGGLGDIFLKGMYSTSARSTVAGFTFYQVGLGKNL